MKNPNKSANKNAGIKPIEVIKYLFALRKAAPISSSATLIFQALFMIVGAVILPIIVAKLLSQITSGQTNLHSSTYLLIAYAALLVLGEILLARLTMIFAYISEPKMQAAVYQQIMDNMLARSAGFHANHMSGEIIANATKLYNNVEAFWDLLIFTITPIITIIGSVSVVLCFVLWQYGIVLAILSVLIIIAIAKLQNSVTPFSRRTSDTSSKITAGLSDTITNIAAVKAFAGEKQEKIKHNKNIEVWRKATRQEMWQVTKALTGFGGLTSTLNVLAFLAAILASQYKVADIAIIYLVLSYTLSVSEQLWSVGRATRQYVRIIGNAGPMIATMQEPITINNPAEPEVVRMNRGAIRFDNVTFRYPDNNQILFENLNLKIQPGEKIGLVGKSGGGKTTLSKLLLRFMDIESGAISIDGQNVTSVRQADLRKHIAYVPQEPMLFHRSISENISYGKPDATQAEIEAVARMAHAHDFIENLPKGYDTLVGERGVKLSGGQRQRVAIARAMLKNAPILLLDEATSALDSESEALIQDALWKLMEGRTAIVIAHRLSTIQQMDRIIVIDEGKIVEEGSHKHLVAKNGTYANLWNHQSGGFLED